MRCVSVAASSSNIFAFSSNGLLAWKHEMIPSIYIGVISSIYIIRCKYGCLCFELLLSLEGLVVSCWRPLIGTHKLSLIFRKSLGGERSDLRETEKQN